MFAHTSPDTVAGEEQQRIVDDEWPTLAPVWT